jgi:phosphotransferase system enzyme I (PtsI)
MLPEIRFKGNAASPGIVVGPILTLRRDETAVLRRRIDPAEVAGEIARLEAALLETRAQLQKIRREVAERLGEKEASVFDAHLMVLDDPVLLEGVKTQLETRLLSVDYIYQKMAKSFARKLQEIPDLYLQERAADVLDVARRVQQNLQGAANHAHPPMDGKCIIFATDLSPSQTATLDRKHVLGFATEAGSRTSHFAILARSLGVPAVVALHHTDGMWEDGVEALIDGYEGLLIINPTHETKAEYEQVRQHYEDVDRSLVSLRDVKAVTRDGRSVRLSANIELPEDVEQVAQFGAEGIGLLRTEFLFLNRDHPPTEDEQVDIYRKMARAAKPHPVTIRTLDVGGDKHPAYLAIEEELNPFLGWRGIRYCLGRPDLFRIQLRAICRAAVEGNIRVMFPMITEITEWRRCRQMLLEVQNELRQHNIVQAEKIEAGILVEVPSVAMTADLFAPEVDFFSIGTNDLIQYTLAVDRGNERVIDLYQPTHPAVIRLTAQVVAAARKHGREVAICGETASDVMLLPLLLGLGVDQLSMGALYIPRVKKALQSLSFRDCEQLAQELAGQAATEENLKRLDALARKLYPEIL